MAVKGILNLNGGNVLTTGDDNVLQPVLDLHVAVFVPYRQVAGVEPATPEGLFGGFGVLQIALHHRIAAQENLTDGFAVFGHWLHGVRVADHRACQSVITNALTGLFPGTIMQWQRIPLGFPGTNGYRAIDFGQTVNVSHLDAHFLDGTNDLGGGCRACCHGLHVVINAGLGGFRHVQQCVKHNRGATHVGNLMIPDQLQNLLGINPAQADVSAGHGGDGPGETPTVAMEHRQGPQVHRVHVHGPDCLVADGIDVGATVMIDHTFWIAGSAGGVVQRDRIPLVLREAPLEYRIPFLKERLVVQIADLNTLAILGIVHIDHQRLGVQPADGVPDHLTELPVGNHNLGLTVIQHEGDGLSVQANVQGVQHRANHGHPEMGFHHRGNIRKHDGNGITASDAAPFEG